MDTPRTQYFDFKRVFVQEDPGHLPSGKDASSEKTYDLVLCLGAEAASGGLKVPPATSEAIELAYRVAIWRHDFPLLGYPADVWQAALVQFEDASLKDIVSGYDINSEPANNVTAAVEAHNFQSRLLETLNAYRKATDSKLPEIISDGGCGGGEEGVRIKLKPATGTVFLQTLFFRKVCQAKHIDPDDRDHCLYWFEAFEDNLTFLAGDYYYIARWSDGAVRKGTFSIRAENEGNSIVLAKP